MTMSTILSSRFVAGIRTEVERVERQLNLFADTLDQWIQASKAAWAAPQQAFHGLPQTSH